MHFVSNDWKIPRNAWVSIADAQPRFETRISRIRVYIVITTPNCSIMLSRLLYRVIQKELYNFSSSYNFFQRTCTVFWTIIMQQNTPSFTWDNYGSMWFPLVMQGVSKRALQWYSKRCRVASVTKTFTLKGVQTIHRSRCWKMDRLYVFKHRLFCNTRHTVTFAILL
jgi:hypothetical protein